MNKILQNKIINMLIILSVILLYSGCINIAFAEDNNVRTFTFTDTAITDNETGDSNYSYKDTDLKITGEGTYIITGSCSNGSITVKKGSENVNLIFKDLTLLNNTTAPVVFAKNTQVNLTITGNVTFEDNILNSEKYLVAQGYATYNESEDTYYCTESGASVLGLSSGDEVEAENATFKTKGNSKVNISGTGILNVTTHSKNAIKAGAALDSNGNDTIGDSSSAYLTIEDVTLNLNATDAYQATNDDTYGDGINAASYLYLKSGTYNISAGDDGIHCDFILDIGDENNNVETPTINITKSYEGIEGSIINIYSGDIDVFADDDSINAANGDILDSSNTNIYNKNYQFAINIYNGDIRAISGSNTTINDGDALDSNGNIVIKNGKVVAFGASNGNAFDTGQDDNHDIDDSFLIENGTVLGVGTSAMAVNPTTNSQNWVSWGSNGQTNGPNNNEPNPNNPPNQNNQTPPDKPSDDMQPPQKPQFDTQNMSQEPSNSSSNMSNTDTIKLVVDNNSYAVGSNINVSKSNSISILNGSDVLINDTAQNNASYVLFSNSSLISNDTSNNDTTSDNDNTNTENTDQSNNSNDTEEQTNVEDTTTAETVDTIDDDDDINDDIIDDESDEDGDNDNKVIKTGDETNLNMYILTLVLSMIVLINLTIYCKKKNKYTKGCQKNA